MLHKLCTSKSFLTKLLHAIIIHLLLLGPIVHREVLDILSSTDDEMEEIILKRSSSGTKLSMVVGKNLFQVIRFNKESVLMHDFSISRTSVLGFKHRSFENLHNSKLLLSLTCIFSFVFITPITSTWTSPWYVADIVFLASLGLLIFAIGNPHVLVFNTKSDKFSVFFFQWGSNRQKASETLSNIGIAMSRFLVTGEFKMPEVTYNIGRIGHNIGRVGDTVATDSVVTEDNILNIPQEE